MPSLPASASPVTKKPKCKIVIAIYFFDLRVYFKICFVIKAEENEKKESDPEFKKPDNLNSNLTVFISNLSFTVDESKIKEVFEKVREPNNNHFNRSN